MKRIDFYKKKEKLHQQIIEAICKILDANMVTVINFKDLGMCGGYVCLATDGSAVEYQIKKLKHDIGTDYLGIEIDDEWGNEIHANINDDVLNASCDTVYEAVYDLFYSKQCKEERKRFYDRQKETEGAAD